MSLMVFASTGSGILGQTLKQTRERTSHRSCGVDLGGEQRVLSLCLSDGALSEGAVDGFCSHRTLFPHLAKILPAASDRKAAQMV